MSVLLESQRWSSICLQVSQMKELVDLKPIDDRVMKSMSIISLCYAESLSRASIAKLVGVSPSRLDALFRRDAGIGVHCALLERRMEQACILLCSTRLCIKEVAFAVGFGCSSHFVRDFKKNLDCAPQNIGKSEYSDRTMIDHMAEDEPFGIQFGSRLLICLGANPVALTV
jgi:AraC-like DNA-binding protein